MSAVEKVFLDTNVLVYAHDRNEATKGPAASSLLTRMLAVGKPLLSVQVLSEFYWTVTRKIPLPLTHDQAVAESTRLNTLTTVIAMTWNLLEVALQVAAAHGFALWDAQIFAAARQNGAEVLLSEDFQHRRVLEGVTFLNPFAADFDPNEVLLP
ncbi:MAG: PIN domain-containing protein [Gemmataceae bacterium]|nr:PIN domain-containing protein [Gemmataceae bacterium]